ncbi:MAG: RICIN domain-containing protein [Micromonosporaceae bacterium]
MLARRRTLAAAAVATALAAITMPASATTEATYTEGTYTEGTYTEATYTVTVGSTGSYAYPTDTPAAAYIDKDGTFYFQQSAALYGSTQPRKWDFYTGTNFDTATKSTTISSAVNPGNTADKNNDTTWRCNHSVTGVDSTYAPAGSGYSQRNFCDLVGTWVDPDTGHWYGLVHNEFTPEPFGAYSFSHYDALDWAVSTNQGRVWTIKGHAITSPYSTKRGDTTAFPHQTFDYGDGDPRLFVDPASGYFYVYYGSRIVPKAGAGGGMVGLAHVARAPIGSKLATGSWQKWHNGSWSQPGVGGKESNMVPVTAANPNGYTPVADDYDPANTGNADQQVAAGELPPKSDLFVMNIAYNAYLGLYVGEPEAVRQSGDEPQRFYVTDDLATQKWRLIGDTGSYTSGSWYRWFVDSANRTSSTIIGKSFRSYCAIACANSSGEYVNLTISSTTPAPPPVDTSKAYTIRSGEGRLLAQVSGSTATTSVGTATGSSREQWRFAGNGDGSYRITNVATGQALGVGSASTGNRAWGTRPTATTLGTNPTVGQQWFVVENRAARGTYRLVNRYGGLVLGMSANPSRLAETTPHRDWTNTTGSTVGGTRTAAEQLLTFTSAETVLVTNPGPQTATTGTAYSRQVGATDSQGRALTFSATGLPPGLSISSSGLISGTPTTAGSRTVTLTASSGSATGSAAFTLAVENPGTVGSLTGTHTVVTSGKALDNPGHSMVGGTQMITWTSNGGVNQSWVFTRHDDGSYQIANGESQLCLDVSDYSTASGGKVVQWSCNGGGNQRWIVTARSGGTYTIAAKHSGLLLTTASTSNGALVTQQADTNGALQHWTIT